MSDTLPTIHQITPEELLGLFNDDDSNDFLGVEVIAITAQDSVYRLLLGPSETDSSGTEHASRLRQVHCMHYKPKSAPRKREDHGKGLANLIDSDEGLYMKFFPDGCDEDSLEHTVIGPIRTTVWRSDRMYVNLNTEVAFINLEPEKIVA